MPFREAVTFIMSVTSFSTATGANGTSSSLRLPESIRLTSMRSEISDICAVAEDMSRPTSSRCSSSSSVVSSSWVAPSTPFIGVRSSWLTLERNSVRLRSAARAAIRARSRRRAERTV